MSVETEEEKTKWVINALENPNWTWRALETVGRELGLPLSEVQEIISKLGSQVIKKDSKNAKGLDLYTTKKHYKERHYGKNDPDLEVFITRTDQAIDQLAEAKSGEVQKVFISYSRADEEFVNKVVHTFDECGIQYFLDRKDINWGDYITRKVQQGLSECSAMLVIISPASLQSQWVPFEIGLAIGEKKKILPLLTDPTLQVPLYLSDFLHKTDIEEVKQYFQLTIKTEQ
jgi:hypothetical protein